MARTDEKKELVVSITLTGDDIGILNSLLETRRYKGMSNRGFVLNIVHNFLHDQKQGTEKQISVESIPKVSDKYMEVIERMKAKTAKIEEEKLAKQQEDDIGFLIQSHNDEKV